MALILILSLNAADQFARYIYCSCAWLHARVGGHEDIFRVTLGFSSILSTPSACSKQAALVARVQNTHTGNHLVEVLLMQ